RGSPPVLNVAHHLALQPHAVGHCREQHKHSDHRLDQGDDNKAFDALQCVTSVSLSQDQLMTGAPLSRHKRDCKKAVQSAATSSAGSGFRFSITEFNAREQRPNVPDVNKLSLAGAM